MKYNKYIKLILINSSILFIFILGIEFGYSIYKFAKNNLSKNNNWITELKDCMDHSKVPIFNTQCEEINSYGSRGIEVNKNNKFNKTALVLGESIAFGWGANYQETWTEKINYKYGDNKLFLYNFGIPSTTIKETEKYYSKLFDLIAHDYIVVFSGWNDLHNILLNDKFK